MNIFFFSNIHNTIPYLSRKFKEKKKEKGGKKKNCNIKDHLLALNPCLKDRCSDSTYKYTAL